MKIRTSACLAAVALGLAMLAGCSSSGSKLDAKIVNSACPMRPDCALKADGNNPTVDFKGETVAFCCKGCISNWNTLSDDDKNARLSKVR